MIVDVDEFKEFEANGSYYTIYDSSVSRFFQHSENGVAIISACRGGIPIGKKLSEFTDEEKARYEDNLKRTENLRNDLRDYRFGYISTLGGYPEPNDKGEVFDVSEFSFVVPRKKDVSEEDFVDAIADLGMKYEQHTVLFSGIKIINGGKATYVAPEKVDEIVMEFDKLSSFRKEQFDPKERPYYTKFTKDPGASFVFASDSKPLYVAIHTPHGMGAHHVGGLKGEIFVYPYSKSKEN